MRRAHALRNAPRIHQPHAPCSAGQQCHVRTYERYGRTYRSPRDLIFSLSDACVRGNSDSSEVAA